MKQMELNRDTVQNWALVIGGELIYALALNLFLVGNHIAAGGLSGLATVLTKVCPLGVGAMVYIMNIPILIAAIIINGWGYTFKTVIFATIYSLAIDGLSFLPTITTDPLVAAVFGGALYGLGMAMITMGYGSVGGTDLLSRLLLKAFPDISIGRMILIIDGSVVVLAMVIFGNVEVGLYAVITIFICSTVGDHAISSQGRGGVCMVVSSQPAHLLATPLMQELGLAVTRIPAIGMYSNSERNVLLVAVRPKDLHKVEARLKEVDPHVFIIVLSASELIGGHFRMRRRYF